MVQFVLQFDFSTAVQGFPRKSIYSLGPFEKDPLFHRVNDYIKIAAVISSQL